MQIGKDINENQLTWTDYWILTGQGHWKEEEYNSIHWEGWHEWEIHLPWLIAKDIKFFWFNASQTLVTSLISTVFFIFFVVLYLLFKRISEKNFFVSFVELVIEKVVTFFDDINKWLPTYAKIYVLFLFFYILWNNLFWLLWDMFATVHDPLHYYFRPVTTDVFFNWILAVVWVFWAIYHWFTRHWVHFFERYFQYKWVWIVSKDSWIIWLIFKPFDILLWLFVWALEFIWELAKVLSLSLRLFWNIFAWVILLTLMVKATISFVWIPLLTPIFVLVVETFIALLQAFVFALLVSVYFKMADASH